MISQIRRTRTGRTKKRVSRSPTKTSFEEAPRARQMAGRASSEAVVSDYEKLQKDYRELTEGVRMIRRATDRAHRGGVLPAIEASAKTPLQQCEAIARAIYRAVRTPQHPQHQHSPRRLTGVAADDL